VGIDVAPRGQPTQYSLQYFFDIQRELPLDTLLTIGYNGNGTRKMLGGINYNIPYNIQPGPTPVNNLRLWPFYNGVNRQLAYGSLSYNGLIAKLEKRFSRGLTFLASYTWSHAIDNLDEVGNGEGTGATYFWDRNQNRVPRSRTFGTRLSSARRTNCRLARARCS
jgi:hypothetical protein